MAKEKAATAPAVDLSQPIDPTLPQVGPLLNDLQGNVLKGHGREHTIHIFLQFKKGQEAATRALIHQFAEDFVTSASEQLQENDDFKKFGISGSVFGNFLLSNKGYDALGQKTKPQDPSFQQGMQAAGPGLNDPNPADWQSGLANDLHAMLLLADDDAAYLQTKARDLMTQWRKVATVTAVEVGKAMVNKNGDHIEHFNYVDGRSQPLFFTTDIEREQLRGDGISVWDPAAPPSLVLVQDPNGGVHSFGSYFVFRKLEQNVRGFKELEEKLAEAMGLTGRGKELAGALVVGRFEDGTPVALQKGEGMHHPVPNNFNYASDSDGARCPFQSHIRKTNPRGDTVRQFGVSDEDERSHRIARRGITYGDRVKHPSDAPSFDEMPTGGVGLLFMCFQSNIANQFEFMQASWANNESFVKPGTGVDPVIGQGGAAGHSPQPWPQEWGNAHNTLPFDFQGFVKLLGGEYFFAPCISFLKSV